ncbi:peptide-N4-asparagine amidase [Intrasporangium sp.]|uniref:peptide-N4-asparagine amidase n=1 Tax=Intrasporangium sp. TaxID=1925024 RepID=UPI003221BE2E
MRTTTRRRLAALTVGAALALAGSVPASALTSDPPAEFGADWDDPMTAEPPVPTPPTSRCSVTIVDHEFRDWSVQHTPYTPPAGCAGPWSKVVLRLDGSVAGRQYDRLGWVDVSGVRVMTLSTPEPSTDGISWHVERDVTDLAPLFRSPGDVTAYIGNTVDDTYTGVFDVTVTLDFYRTGAGQGPAVTADRVQPLESTYREGGDLVGSLTVPRNTDRLLAEVYATGSGGGCEEFWDTSAPADTGYSCPDGLPYREVDVLLDGRVAGVALPYPVVYTGGWSNPYLWAASPSPKAFDIPALRYDLTPFAGLLNDGRPHEVRIHVAGLAAEQSSWTLSPRFQVWTDRGRDVVRGGLLRSSAPAPAVDATVSGQDDGPGRVELTGRRAFSATGWLETSGGHVVTTVRRTLENRSEHTWTAGETRDALDATWTDTASTGRIGGNDKPALATRRLGYAKRGFIDVAETDVPGAQRITTTLDIGYTSSGTSTDWRAEPSVGRSSDRFTGTASWLYGVPRDQRHATANTTKHVTRVEAGPHRCYDRTVTAVNGYFTRDHRAC